MITLVHAKSGEVTGLESFGWCQHCGTAGPASSSLLAHKLLTVAAAVQMGAKRAALGLLGLHANQVRADPVCQLF